MKQILESHLAMWIPKVAFSFYIMYEHAKNQLSSFIHSWIQHIMESRDLKTHTHISQCPPITIEVTFSFLKYVLACKKSARFIYSLKLESYSSFWPHSHPKIIKVILNFPEFASVHPFIHLFSPCGDQGGHNFLTTPIPIFFYQLLISSINM